MLLDLTPSEVKNLCDAARLLRVVAPYINKTTRCAELANGIVAIVERASPKQSAALPGMMAENPDHEQRHRDRIGGKAQMPGVPLDGYESP